ncbi:MAG: sulfatase-like hydrolase/transferase [Anaerolineae bacterium]|nr:sulfatase-like hydrolase/transferase [Anaerolineae bacterium]
MRVLYIDIDSLRPDHLGCYGYHRNTSPNIDALAEQSVRFDNVYISDAPCLPSRTALWSGRCGFRNGVVGHGGTAADPFVEGPTRGFRDVFAYTGWMAALRQAGMYTATVSSFGERHAAWHWYAGYNEIYNPGKRGMDTADDVTPVALEWLQQHGEQDNWFLHVNYWDPHTPYRTPEAFGNPFENDPLPDWMTEDMRKARWEGFGPHSAQEPHGYGEEVMDKYPRLPKQLDSMESLKRWIDGYDVGIRYVDEHIGRLVNALSEMGILDDTVIVISADHAENQGELNVFGDHQTADDATCRIPLIIRWAGSQARVDHGLHYHFDWAATLIELAGGQVPDNWDGQSFAEAFQAGEEGGREYLVTSQNAWACQRGVRFDRYLCLRSYHDGYKMVEPLMLFDLEADPHEQHDLSAEMPEVVNGAMSLLANWEHEMMLRSEHDVDPLMTVLREGGPFHTRGELAAYLKRLRATDRGAHADRLETLHPDEI